MVNVAIAGGTGELAREVIDALVASPIKHSILILGRSPPTPTTNPHNLPFQQVNYSDLATLTRILANAEIHTVLSFIQPLHDPDNVSQRTLIDACIQAGVTRFAPSEYGGITSPGPDASSSSSSSSSSFSSSSSSSSSSSLLPGWSQKHLVATYLSAAAADSTLQHTVFRPSLLLNYLASPRRTSPHLTPLQTPFVCLRSRRAVRIEGRDPYVTFTSVRDLARVVARAVSQPAGAWPAVSGIRGERVRLSELIAICERVRGCKFNVETVKVEDLERGILTSSWGLEISHPSVSSEHAEAVKAMLKQVTIGILLESVKGSWDVSDEWNKILEPEGFKFTGIEEFLRTVSWDEETMI